MALPGECLASFPQSQGRPVYRAAGVVWWEPVANVLEPLVTHIPLDEEARNIEILLAIAGKSEARFATASGNGPTPPVRLWTPVQGLPREARGDIAPLAAWQLPDRRFAELVARHEGWSGTGLFDWSGGLTAWLVACEDSGWVHEVAASEGSGADEIRLHWQSRIARSDDWRGMVGGADRLGFVAPALRWSALRRRWWSRKAG